MDKVIHDPAILSDDADDASQRSGSRDSLLLTAALKIDGVEEQVRIRNLSSGGLMAEFPEPVAVGTPVKIDVRGIGKVGGRIAWCTDGRIGIAFDREIDPLAARKPVVVPMRKPMPAPARKQPVGPRR